MRSKAWFAVLLSICATTAAELTLVPVAEAGANDAVLTGVVRNPDTNERLEGATVIVTGANLQGERTQTTDSGGLYRIPDLPPGDYEVTVIYGKAKRKGTVTLRSRTTTRFDFSVRPAEDVTEIIVESSPVDVASSSVGLSIDNQLSRRVPIAVPTGKGGANRSFEAIAEITPGAAGDLYGTSVAGSTSPENKYYVDGLSVSDPGFGLNGTALTVEFLQEVRVESGGYMPEFGRSTGGIVNAVTKTGSNEFHGGVWVYYSPGQLEGYRKPPLREGQTIQGEQQLLWLGDAGFDIGGRLIRDKLWFYGGVSVSHTTYDVKTSWNRLVIDDMGMPMVNPTTEFNVTERIPGSVVRRKAQGSTVQALAKLTYAPNSHHRINLLGIYAPSFSGGNGTYGMDAQTGAPEYVVNATYEAGANKHRDDAADVQLEWNALLDDNRWEINTVLGWHNQINQSLPIDGSKPGSGEGLAGQPGIIYRRNNPDYHPVTDFVSLPPGADPNACDPWVNPSDPTMMTTTCPATNFSTGGPGFIYDRRLNRLQARSTAGRLAIGAGHHLVKFGVDFEYMQYDSNRGYTGSTLYREATGGAYYTDYRRYGYLTGPDQAVILDSLKWRVFSTTIGGFIQDSWQIMDKVTLNAGLRYDMQHLFGGDGKLSLALPNQISPRAGLIWDPTQAGKAKLFVNYARFYQSVPLNLADRAGSGEPSLVSLYDAGLCNPQDANNVCQTDPSLKWAIGGTSDPDRYWFGYGAGKTAIDPKLRPQSSDEVVLGGEYEVLPGARLGLTYQHRWLNRVVEDMSNDEATTYFIGNPGYGIASAFPKGRRVYDALILYIDKRFSQNWLLNASYTMSFLRGNMAGLFRPETGQLDPNINSDFDLVSLLANRFGYLPGDHRHAFKVFTAGEIPLVKGNTILLGGAFRATSGAPTNALASHELYGTGESYLIPRGTGERLPWTFRIDTNIGYRKYFTKDLSMDITMDVFNVANFQAAIATDQNYTFSDVIPIEGGSLEDLTTHTDVNGDPIVKNPNFGKPIAFQSPRQFRFGVRLNF
jgi:hypothetical protein